MLVTEEHLEKSRASEWSTTTCILATAFNYPVGLWHEQYVLNRGEDPDDQAAFCENGQRLGQLFDSRQFDKIQELLPIEVNLIPQEV